MLRELPSPAQETDKDPAQSQPSEQGNREGSEQEAVSPEPGKWIHDAVDGALDKASGRSPGSEQPGDLDRLCPLSGPQFHPLARADLKSLTLGPGAVTS